MKLLSVVLAPDTKRITVNGNLKSIFHQFSGVDIKMYINNIINKIELKMQ